MATVVESLVQILQGYACFFREIIPLYKKARCLRNVYEQNYLMLFWNGENEDLEARIRTAAYEAEDLFIDVDHKDYNCKFNYLTEVLIELESIVQEILRRLHLNSGTTTSLSMSYPNLHVSLSRKSYVVGFEKQINELLYKLISRSRSGQELEIIPIVGTAGSGKTKLAQQVLKHSRITFGFHIRAWITISQPFDLRTVLLDILYSCGHGREFDEESIQSLGKFLRSTLFFRKYLIILDNVCSCASLDMLQIFFPDNRNGSRIMLTTRNRNISNNIGSCDPQHMTPLDGDASFKLLGHLLFGELPFPSKLEDIGSKIARNCAGCPLAVVLVANVLSRTGMSNDFMSNYFWERVETRQLYHIMNEVSNVNEEQMLEALTLSPLLSSSSSSTRAVVGFERAISQLTHQLTLEAPELQVVPIVGPGGSGKTTLARQLYDHSLITDHFKTRAWITISESFDLRVSLLGLMGCLLIHKKVHVGSSDEQLGENLNQILKHKKYFIVVDDIWNASAWEELRRFFPDDQNGSRIVLTTRERSWGDYVKSSSTPHEMQPMSEDESWDLIVWKVSRGIYWNCPPELQEIGRKIVRNCRGLPLAVAAAAGILSKTNKTVDAWNHVESCKFYSMGDMSIQDDSSLKVLADSFSKDGRRLLDLILNGRQRKLQVIPIVGPGGGSGKTTLGRLIYDRSLLSNRFSAHAWVTSSQHKEVNPLLRDLLDSLGEANNENPCVIDDKRLAEHVHKALHGRRYLIVLDDIKDKNTWDLLRRYFQDNSNGSRIILTAREWSSDEHDMKKILKVDSYWDFLIKKAFEQDCSSSEKPHAQKFWELVCQDKKESLSEGDLQSDLLSMTYNTLPYHLKPCFLYMGALPEDFEIKSSKIINLWIAEGFVRPQPGCDLEDIAEKYLMDLISRNLLSVRQRVFNGKVAAVKIHDVFWKFCSKKAIEENFVWFKDLEGRNISEDEENVRRVSVNSLSQDTDLTGLDSAHSFLCFARVSEGTQPTFLNLTLLRVLDVLQFEFIDFPKEMLELENLRYLAFTCPADIPSSIAKFQYLLFLVIAKALSLPKELWSIKNLRHIKCKKTWLWGSFNGILRKDLQSLSDVPASLVCGFIQEENSLSEEDTRSYNLLSNVPASLVCDFIPEENSLFEEDTRSYSNLRKLGIFFRPEDEVTISDLSLLRKVEVLKCTSSDWLKERRNHLSFLRCPLFRKRGNHLSFLTFSFSLKKLTLKYCNIPYGVMSVIGGLRRLEHLILQHIYFESDIAEPKWEPMKRGYPKLRVLKMEGSNLVHWEVDRWNQFSELRHLVIRGCHSMQQLPHGLYNIPSLQLIEVDTSSPGVVQSAVRIKKYIEMEDDKNNFFEVVVQELEMTYQEEQVRPSLNTYQMIFQRVQFFLLCICWSSTSV